MRTLIKILLGWTCGRCGTKNDADLTACGMCGMW